MRKTIIVVAGPTASGKSEVGLEVASRIGGEIVSADSVQIYRGMDIGSAKLLLNERGGIPHHMLDVALPSDSYTVGRYQQEARHALESILKRGRVPVVVGGSGLYISAITDDLAFGSAADDPGFRAAVRDQPTSDLYEQLRKSDPEAAARIHPHNRPRIVRALELGALAERRGSRPYRFREPNPAYTCQFWGLDVERPDLYARINQRTQKMLEDGLIEEVRRLLSEYPSSRILHQAIGYKEVIPFLQKGGSINEVMEEIQRNTRRLAKRQLTWLRGEGRVRWTQNGNCEETAGQIVAAFRTECDF